MCECNKVIETTEEKVDISFEDLDLLDKVDIGQIVPTFQNSSVNPSVNEIKVEVEV